jgi:hypothetical protein
MKILLLLLLLWTTPLFATTYYVSKSGSDQNSCVAAQGATKAKLTIAQGLRCMVAGDILLIGDGTYNERITNAIPSGTAAKPTVVRAENARLAILRPNDSTLGDRWYYGVEISAPGSQYITIDGLKVDVSLTTGYAYAIHADSGTVHHITLQNGEATGADGDCAGYFPSYGYSSGCAGILIGSHSNPTGHQNIQVSKMVAHGNTEGGFYISGATNVLVEDSEAYGNGYAFQMFDIGNHSSTGNIFRRNNFHDNVGHAGYPVYGWSVMLTDSPSVEFSNNLVWGNRGGVHLGYTQQQGAKVLSNTIVGNTLNCIRVDAGSSGSIVRNNICRNNGSDVISNSGTSTTQSNNLLATDPLFVGPSSGNFRLKAASAAIAAGLYSSLVPTDKDGLPRPTPPSIGAYEGQPAIIPAPPTGLRADN